MNNKNNRLKFDLVIRKDGQRITKDKGMNFAQLNARVDKIVNKKLSVIDKNLFGGIVVSIPCFGIFALNAAALITGMM